MLGCDERQEIRADALLFGQSKQPAIVLVDERPRAVGQPFDDELCLVLDDEPVARFTFTKPLLHMLPLGDVTENAEQP